MLEANGATYCSEEVRKERTYTEKKIILCFEFSLFQL